MTTLREWMLDVRARNGNELTPGAVLEAAADPTSPAHHRFTWDDTAAAQQWRLEEARRLIREVRITFVSNDKPITLRAFHAVRDGEGANVYEPTEQIAADPVAAELLSRQMRRDWHQFKQRWQDFAEFRTFIAAQLAGDLADAG